MAADEKILGALHDAVARALSLAMEGTVMPGYTDPDTGEEVPERRIPPSAAEIQAAAKFLKDNNITCTPAKDNALGDLQAKMEARRAKRVDRADLASASEGMGFLTGLPN